MHRQDDAESAETSCSFTAPNVAATLQALIHYVMRVPNICLRQLRFGQHSVFLWRLSFSLVQWQCIISTLLSYLIDGQLGGEVNSAESGPHCWPLSSLHSILFWCIT